MSKNWLIGAVTEEEQAEKNVKIDEVVNSWKPGTFSYLELASTHRCVVDNKIAKHDYIMYNDKKVYILSKALYVLGKNYACSQVVRMSSQIKSVESKAEAITLFSKLTALDFAEISEKDLRMLYNKCHAENDEAVKLINEEEVKSTRENHIVPDPDGRKVSVTCIGKNGLAIFGADGKPEKVEASVFSRINDETGEKYLAAFSSRAFNIATMKRRHGEKVFYYEDGTQITSPDDIKAIKSIIEAEENQPLLNKDGTPRKSSSREKKEPMVVYQVTKARENTKASDPDRVTVQIFWTEEEAKSYCGTTSNLEISPIVCGNMHYLTVNYSSIRSIKNVRIGE